MHKVLLLASILLFAGCTSPNETQSTPEVPQATAQSEYHFVADLQGDGTLYVQVDTGSQSCEYMTAATGKNAQTGVHYFRVSKHETGWGMGTGGGGMLANVQAGPIDTDTVFGGGLYSSASGGSLEGNVTLMVSGYGLQFDDFGFVMNGSIAFSITCPEPIAMPTFGLGTFLYANPDQATVAAGGGFVADTRTAVGTFSANLDYDNVVFYLGHAGTGLAGRLHVDGAGFSGQYTMPVSDNIWEELQGGDYTMTLAYEFAGTFDIYIGALYGFDVIDATPYLGNETAINTNF